MKRQEPCSRAAFFPCGSFEAVPAFCVQQTLQGWFERWGRPQQLQFDHGQPWCSSTSDLPTLFELWLVGLGIDVVWTRVHHPQDNGIVERSHRTTQAWSAPACCRSLEQLQQALDQAVRIQRQVYPNPQGTTRLQRYPHLLARPRPYHRSREAQLWSIDRVYAVLEHRYWQRKVDASGRISLYNHNYTIARRLANQSVWVCFDSTTCCWVVLDATGHEVGRVASLEINSTTITQLQLHRSRAKHRTHPASPP